MTLKLKPASNPPSPFSWDSLSPSPTPADPKSLPSAPTSWLSARDMKLFGAQPLTSVSDIGLVKCKDCGKPILRSFISEHTDLCATIRAGGKKGAKGKVDLEGSKKRKASPSPDDPSQPAKKKAKPATKVTKGRIKGPVDYDKQCGVINDKNLPCSRSLTCKSHSMGAKRAVQGRSRSYDELLLEWQRANNPNFVEPVKRETKAEKKEKREREKLEKKRLAGEAAAALGADAAAASAGKKSTTQGSSKKVGKKAAAAAAAAVRLAEEMGDDVSEDLDDLDSEAEVDELIRVVKITTEKGVVGIPLAVPCDAGSWFVQRRERARCCRDLLIGALGNGGTSVTGALGIVNRSSSLGNNVGMGRLA
ncbi:SCA7, zinc-binding domain-containing protein [Crucibulum laeve]|uniref:SCA7, zinc-binding domain-containing protein n=1 Tax=Crucibulum laeve TaxID=68775 RepID=A0A5C3LI70_9AGAR|nr:SCA7, zinc-binding domain-containing protein [Crucibulum laeve]